MKRLLGYAAVLATGMALMALSRGADQRVIAADADELMLAHNVYFTLKDNSPEAKKKLIEGCEKHLASIEGIVFFACGSLTEDLKREVNVRDWDVGLHVVFKNRAAHDKYQPHPKHLEFIKEHKEQFKSVKVYDDDVRVTPIGKAAN